MTTDVPVQPVEIAMHLSGGGPGGARRVVVLKASAGLYLPIWIGADVSDAINARASGMEFPRPSTHDLLEAALTTGGGEVERVLIDRLEADTFYAQIRVRTGGELREIDARPSDAIAIAVGCGAPMFVAESVLGTAGFEMDLLSGIVTSAADGGGVLNPDADGNEAAPVTIGPPTYEMLGLKAGDRLIAWVPRGPIPERAVGPAPVESINGQVPWVRHDLSPFGVPVSLACPRGWFSPHPTVHHPPGAYLGQTDLWASARKSRGLTAAVALDRIIQENVGSLERLEDDGTFVLGPGFEATALTRTTADISVANDPDRVMTSIESRAGAITRWMVAVAGDQMVISGLESVDWDRWKSVEPLLSETAVLTEARGVGDLTTREVEVLNHIADGATNAQIAERLDLSPHTVGNHVRSILAKLEAANRTQAASYGFARGIIEDASHN